MSTDNDDKTIQVICLFSQAEENDIALKAIMYKEALTNATTDDLINQIASLKARTEAVEEKVAIALNNIINGINDISDLQVNSAEGLKAMWEYLAGRSLIPAPSPS